MAEQLGHVWDRELIDVLYLDDTDEGLVLTTITGKEESLSITLPVERVRELRLKLQQYERSRRG